MATATTQLTKRDQLYIGGNWVDPSGSDAIDVINSTTEEVMGTIPAGSPEDADRAVAAAREAFVDWSVTPREQRAAYLEAIAAGLSERLGMPIGLSRQIQAGLPTMSFASMPALMETVAWEEEVGNSLVVREPIGVLGAI